MAISIGVGAEWGTSRHVMIKHRWLTPVQMYLTDYHSVGLDDPLLSAQPLLLSVTVIIITTVTTTTTQLLLLVLLL